MGRLIDADELKKVLDDYCGTQKYLISENVRKIIDNMPTAFDVDEVVEQLKENSKMIYRKTTSEDEHEDDEDLLDMVHEYVINSSTAQFIVKKGGKE